MNNNTVIEKVKSSQLGKATVELLNGTEVLGNISESDKDNGLLAGKGIMKFSCSKIAGLENGVFEHRAYVMYKLPMKDAVPYLDANVRKAYDVIRQNPVKEQLALAKKDLITKRAESIQKILKTTGLSNLEQRIALNIVLGKENAKVEILREIVLEIRAEVQEDGTYNCSGVINQNVIDHLGNRGILQLDTVLFPTFNTTKIVQLRNDMFEDPTVQKALGKIGTLALFTELNSYNEELKSHFGNYSATFKAVNEAMSKIYEKNVAKMDTLRAIYK